ncbi:MAG: sensor histidine kinase [Vallitaleaceae bacterium]|nr:sensor histidine kinase [Vallitaleaceae bacterium]
MYKKISKAWSGWSIRIKFFVSIFIVLAISATFNLYLNNSNYATTDQFNSTMMNYYTINNLQQLVKENRRALDNYLSTLDTNEKDDYETTKNAIVGMLEPMYNSYSTMEIYFSIKAIINSTDNYFENFDEAIIQKEIGNKKYYEVYYAGIDIQQYTNNYIQKLLDQSVSEGAKRYNQLVEKADIMRHISVIVIVGGFALAIIIGLLLSNYLVKPIKRLAEISMHMARGDLEVDSMPITSKDELGVLAESFNIMSENINIYVKGLEEKVEIKKKLYEEELKTVYMERLVKDAKYEVLQSQINPHFLFNTLNSISRMAMFEKARDTRRITEALSNLFRYRLTQNKTMVTLAEELHIVGEYIYLQQVRFGERLQYTQVVDEACMDTVIPVFLLQPIVENAIIHGIEPKVDGGTVSINVSMEKKEDGIPRVAIRVIDTGIGMTQDQLQKVKMYSTEQRDSIGVGNVYQRFMAASNQTGEFSIDSDKDVGITVTFIFEKGVFL